MTGNEEWKERVVVEAGSERPLATPQGKGGVGREEEWRERVGVG